MIERYTSQEMGHIWTLENEFRTMLKVEILACEAMNKLGIVPDDALHDIQTKADFRIERIKEIEAVTNHDIIAFLTNVAEYVGDASKYIHKGLTSSDVKDTAMGVMMQQSADVLMGLLEKLHEVLKRRAAEHKHTIMIGRTHGIHAEPMTFGLKFALWMDETERNMERLKQAREFISVGKLSGAVGTYSNIDPFVEEYVCEKLGIKAARLATQVIQRDRHADYLTTIAIIGSSLEKWQPKSVICSVPISARRKNILPRDRKAVPQCRINATRLPAKKFPVWQGCCAGMPLPRLKTLPCGTSEISPILP